MKLSIVSFHTSIRSTRVVTRLDLIYLCQGITHNEFHSATKWYFIHHTQPTLECSDVYLAREKRLQARRHTLVENSETNFTAN